MPSVFTLEGASVAKSLAESNDTPLLAWLRQQNPFVFGAVVLGLSLGVGFVVATLASHGVNRFKKATRK